MRVGKPLALHFRLDFYALRLRNVDRREHVYLREVRNPAVFQGDGPGLQPVRMGSACVGRMPHMSGMLVRPDPSHARQHAACNERGRSEDCIGLRHVY